MVMTYQEELKLLYHIYNKTEFGFNIVAKRLQESYPGNYGVEEYYNPMTANWDARLKFQSEKDEMWFRLKYD